MTCALEPSITDSSPLRYPGINRHLRRYLKALIPSLQACLTQSAQSCGAERYRKHFDSFAHFILLLFHSLSGSPSLRQTYATFSICPGLIALSGLDPPPRGAGPGISFSEFAHSNSSRPYEFLLGLIPSLSHQVLAQKPHSSLPKELLVLDSTFLPLSMALASWLPRAQKKSGEGVRVQVEYSPALDLPEHFLITDSRTNDCQGLDELVLDQPAELARLRGQTLVVDLGYYSHRRYLTLLDSGIHLVSRLNEQAHYELEEELPHQENLFCLPGERVRVLSDALITLGSPNNRAGALIPNLRLVQAEVWRGRDEPLLYQIITDRWDLPASEVVLLYLYRWGIELFFRWLKSHIKLDRLLGYSPNAVTLSVILALVVHLICLLAGMETNYGGRSAALLRQLALLLTLLDLSHPQPMPRQLVLPGWEEALC